MMNTFTGGLNAGFTGVIWPFHILFCLIFLVGLVLFLVWLVQFLLKKKQLFLWAVILFIIGILGMLLTFRWGTFGIGSFGNNLGFEAMYQHMLDEPQGNYNSVEDYRSHMLDEMRQYMGLE